MQEIESGNFSVPRWSLFSPDSVRVVSWNIDRGAKLHKVIEFLAGEKADIVLLQEADLNARRTQHINVAACRFYERQGCVLEGVNHFAYRERPDEIQLLWYKDLSLVAASDDAPRSGRGTPRR